MRVKRLAAVVVMSLCLATTTSASNWTGGDGDWSLGTNWSAGVPDGTDAYIGNGQIVTLDTDEPDITTLDVSWFSTLNIEPGAGLTASGEASVASGGNDTGIVAQSGGVVSLNSNLIVGEAAGGIASWTMTDNGTLAVGTDLAVGGLGVGTFELGDTSALTVAGNINIAVAGGSGTMTVSGGTLGQLAGGGDPAILADLTVGSTGTFAVEGSAPIINVANYVQGSGGSLDVSLGNTGVSTIYADGNMTLSGTLNVRVEAGTPDGIYDIMVATGTRVGNFTSVNLPDGVKLRYGSGSSTAKLYVGVEPPDAPTSFPGEYLIVGTDTAGGGVIYEIVEGALVNAGSLPSQSGARIGYYHATDGYVYFTQDMTRAWKMKLDDVLNPNVVAPGAEIWMGQSSNDDSPARMVQGPDGEIYTHTRYGHLWHYEPLTDGQTVVTDNMYHSHHHDEVAYGDGIYLSSENATNLNKFTYEGAGAWSDAQVVMTGWLDARGNMAVTQDGILFGAQHGTSTVKYVDLDDLGGSPVVGTLPAIGSGVIQFQGGLAVNSDGTRLYVAGDNGGGNNFLGYYDLSSGLGSATWVELVASGGFPDGLTGNGWGLTYIDTRTGGDPPGPTVPEPAGLGLIGLSLLALKKRRR